MIRRIIYDVEFRVLVKETLSPIDSLLVTGSCEQLGEWSPKRCVPLNRLDKTTDGELWSANIKIYGPQKVSYRYVIGQIVRMDDDDRNLIVKKCNEKICFFIERFLSSCFVFLFEGKHLNKHVN